MIKANELSTRLQGTPLGRVLTDLFSNSAHFAIANIIFESLNEGLGEYVTQPDLYAMLFAVLLQSYVLGGMERPSKAALFLGNLIGVTVYTAIEVAIEGTDFFDGANHLLYWVFSAFVAVLKVRRAAAGPLEGDALLVVDGIARAALFVAMYGLFEAKTDPKYASLAGFLSDSSHVFVLLVVPLLGAVLGFMAIVASRRVATLYDTAGQLRNFSEWSMGRDLVSRAVANPTELALKRRERTVLFMDIRGFTHWSEEQTPEAVVSMLNAYFEASERVWTTVPVVIARLIADEVFLVLDTAEDALSLAARLKSAAEESLSPYGLHVGIGVNQGPLMEGMIGSGDIRVYDVIGDTVNTGARFCSAAQAGEILVAERIAAAAGEAARFGPVRSIAVKGKRSAIAVRPLLAP